MLLYMHVSDQVFFTVVCNASLSKATSIGSAFLFALALVVAGQSSSITATLAGQVVGEGFIEWRVSVGFSYPCLALTPDLIKP